jgi:plastocyanin
MKAVKSKVLAGALALAGVATIVPCAVAQQVATPASRTSISGRVAIVERPGESTSDLGNTVIYLVPLDSASPAMPAVATSIAMNGRAFVPRLRVVTPGSRVAFPNQDPFSHNIFSTATGSAFDLGLYPAGKSKDARFRRAGAVPVYCNIHPRMTAFIFVAPTPWFTQAGNDGRWTIDQLPPGRYTLRVWHERTKEVETEVTVGLSGLSGLATQLDARGFRLAQHKNKFGKEYDKTGKDRY